MRSSLRKKKRRQSVEANVPKGGPPDPNYLRDHERGIGLGLKPHPKRMPMQAAPDHGDHYE
jgi:hypothetical protein